MLFRSIEIVDGKAKVVRSDYCDGIGNCLPVCPVGAISFSDQDIKIKEALPCGCPGNHSKIIQRKSKIVERECEISKLRQWPVQIKLVPEVASYFDQGNLLIAADCSAYAYAAFHEEFIKNHVTLIGCPKLDAGDYTKKLTAIITNNNIKSITVTRMEVPCCGGLEHAVKQAWINSGKMIPWQVVTISVDGTIFLNLVFFFLFWKDRKSVV